MKSYHLRMVSACLALLAFKTSAAVLYVDASGTNPAPPYADWSNAATTIQDAVDAATDGDLILVTNGVYQTGGQVVYGSLTNRVAVTKPLTLQSINGPTVTMIQGYQDTNTIVGDDAVRCVYLTNNTALVGFTLTGGATRSDGDPVQEQSGAGVWSESTNVIVTNCTLIGNSATASGGGAYSGRFNNCMFISNSVPGGGGGGVESGMLNGCTLTGNSALNGGAVELGALNNCIVISNTAGNAGGGFNVCTATNCLLTGNSSGSGAGGAENSTLADCTLTGNSANQGGGTEAGTLAFCTLSNNFAYNYGGGANGGELDNCTVTGNTATNTGGGVYAGTLYNCIISGNISVNGGGVESCNLNQCSLIANTATINGGGADGGTLNNCTVTGNSAVNAGGGANSCTLNNCGLTGNSSGYSGGGVESSTLDNCTLTGNSAVLGGGAYASTLNNCIAFYNTASSGNNFSGSTLNFSCTIPLPDSGISNIVAAPQLTDATHIGAGSPCIGAGSSDYSTGVDIDGEPWLNPPSIGCDEYSAVSPTGSLSVAIQAGFTNVATGLVVNFSGVIMGHAGSNTWDFGDGTVVSNQLSASHSWSAAGTYPVVLTVYNDSNPAGVSATIFVQVLDQPVAFVSVDSINPVAPYLTWATAATNLQDAVDAVSAGGRVWVTNGIYRNGGRALPGQDTNVMLVLKPLTVQSVNGPDVTVIDGSGAIRCVYLSGGTTLAGFDLTNGSAYSYGGGVLCESAGALVTNCILACNVAGYEGGGVYGVAAVNCTFTNNYAYAGGAAANNSLDHCTLINNRSFYGGGAYGSSLLGCTLTGNFTYEDSDHTANGGGASSCLLTNCVLSGNTSLSGGGAAGCTLVNCLLTGNSGGGSYSGGAGGADASILVNCTVVGNAADNHGGVRSSVLTNCIVYFNTAPSGTNYSDDSTFYYCDTMPLATNGANNIASDPSFADSAHISSSSPCRGAGIFSAASGVDMDGDAWLNPPSIGCDEFNSASATGALAVVISAEFTNVAAGFTINFSGQVSGHASDNRWDFGDGNSASNRLAVAHSWSAPGNYTVTFTAFNGDNPSGVSAFVVISVLASPVHYVALGNPSPTAPYLSWATAAANIQDAVDAAYAGGTILVSNGIYQAGGRIVSGLQSNRVAVAKPILVRSVNGPMFTTIQGNSAPDDSAVRCVYLTNRVTLAGFTLNGGGTRATGDMDQTTGGGAWCGDAGVVISNCVFSGNSAVTAGGGVFQGTVLNCWFLANKSGANGGGANSATLFNCALTGNSAGANGGGAEGCTLANCTLTRNFASGSGGGVDGSTLTNCIVYFNDALGQPDYSWSSFNYCCTTPPADGAGNITSAPLLLDSEHVASGSPCIGAGNVAAATGADIDGDAWRMPPSIGCDEFYFGGAGTLGVAIQGDYTNFAPNLAVNFYEVIVGDSSASRWDFGDGSSVTNQLLVSHSWSAPGNYAVTFTAFNSDNPGGVSTAMIVYIASNAVHYVSLASTNPVSPFLTWDTAATNIQDAVDAATVPGALVLATNGVYQSGSRITNGSFQVSYYSVGESETNRLMVTKAVTVASVNGAAFTAIDGAGVVRCVYLGTGATLQGFTLTNGYIGGDGGGAWCASKRAVIRDCTLANNYANNWGGGVSSGSLSNCAITGNSAYNGAGAESSMLLSCAVAGNTSTSVFFGSGGGVDNCLATNCTINGNRSWYGGGAASSTLDGCTLSGNYNTQYGAGAHASTLNRCVVSGNIGALGAGISYSTANNSLILGNLASVVAGAFASSLTNCTLVGNDPYGANQSVMDNCISYYNNGSDSDSSCTLNYCCVEIDTGGIGNITNAPLFVNQGTGDFHLQTNSPCINSGNNYVTMPVDFDGNPRIRGGTVDIGAYEYQRPASIISYAWLMQYGFPIDGSADSLDSDGDGFSNWQEWRTWTDPTDASSYLKMLSTSASGDPAGVTITWLSANGVPYFLQRGTNLTATPVFSTIQTNIVGQPGTTSYTDTDATNAGPYFYRVGVQ